MNANPDRFRVDGSDGNRTDWVNWHSAYESENSSMNRRLAVVQRRLREVFQQTSRSPTVLSLCAGDGRDLIDVWPELGLAAEARAVLVEVAPELVDRAAERAAGQEQIEVRCADASDVGAFADVGRVDVLLICGLLGNIDPAEVDDVAKRTTGLVKGGGYVIWTRGSGGRGAVDRREDVRVSFKQAGFDELAYDGAPEPFGVGVGRLIKPGPPITTAEPLFTFVR